MDEILIEEKKYVSSKRAAQITGYAKDYIGQLCREGRVPARLVGRSWYVLESAIQDHRFGNQGIDPKPPVEEKKIVKPTISDTWESPRYEAQEVTNTSIPPVNRLEEEKEQIQEDAEASRDLHDSWKSWFSHFESSVPVSVPAVVTADLVIEPEDSISSVRQESSIAETEEESIDVPIHIMDQKYPPKGLLPRNIDYREQNQAVFEKEEVQPVKETHVTTIKIRITKLLLAIGVLVAVSLTVLSIIGSGYIDNILVSFNRAGYITGISIYIK